jgi:hypothetical protein
MTRSQACFKRHLYLKTRDTCCSHGHMDTRAEWISVPVIRALLQPHETTIKHTETVTPSRFLPRCATAHAYHPKCKPRNPGARTNTGETGIEDGCGLRTLDKTWSTTKMRRVTTREISRLNTMQPRTLPPVTRTRRWRLKLTSNTHLALEHLSETKNSEKWRRRRPFQSRIEYTSVLVRTWQILSISGIIRKCGTLCAQAWPSTRSVGRANRKVRIKNAWVDEWEEGVNRLASSACCGEREGGV